MTNKDLINSIAGQTGMTKKQVADLLSDTNSIILTELMKGKAIQINEFGTLEVRTKKERVSVHPVTKVRTIVPPKQQLNFKQSPILKEVINKR
ncbi:MAG: HU family DNA-binding protein [Paludibacteraceae bacterium]|nr:HU family DNA-binding protein [Paludibacteraceae bacterium]